MCDLALEDSPRFDTRLPLLCATRRVQFVPPGECTSSEADLLGSFGCCPDSAALDGSVHVPLGEENHLLLEGANAFLNHASTAVASLQWSLMWVICMKGRWCGEVRPRPTTPRGYRFWSVWAKPLPLSPTSAAVPYEAYQVLLY